MRRNMTESEENCGRWHMTAAMIDRSFLAASLRRFLCASLAPVSGSGSYWVTGSTIAQFNSANSTFGLRQQHGTQQQNSALRKRRKLRRFFSYIN